MLGYALVSALGIVPFDGVLLAFLVAAAGVVIWRHRANIGRILAGREPRLGEGAAPRS